MDILRGGSGKIRGYARPVPEIPGLGVEVNEELLVKMI